MASNSFGEVFRFSTWGESHGPAIGCVVDGVPPRLPVSETDIQFYLDRRKPGQNRFTTQRQEPDQVKILSDVFEGQTTGTPIGLMIENTDQRSKDYGDIMSRFRPGHADYTYEAKYGIRDYRGGGRSSARETAMRVAAGAIARKIISARLGNAFHLRGALVQVGPHKVNRDNWDWEEVERNPFWSPDAKAAETWTDYLDGVRKSGSSAGAVIEIVAEGVPAGLGEPVYGKLDSDLAAAMMTINAVKGVEIGDGFAAAEIPGHEAADEMRMDGDTPVFLSNHAGGVLGGISNGQDLIVRIAVKPPSSIVRQQKTIDKKGKEQHIRVLGKHDPCIAPRVVPVAEAMLAIVLADHFLRQKCID